MRKFKRIYDGKIIIWNGEKPNKLKETDQPNIEIPIELLKIAEEWFELSSKTGDIGCCVIGAKMEFDYQGAKYKMYPQSPFQGELSWTRHLVKIEESLEKIGATGINYSWGMMD
jgi:hypothetical protein